MWLKLIRDHRELRMVITGTTDESNDKVKDAMERGVQQLNYLTPLRTRLPAATATTLVNRIQALLESNGAMTPQRYLEQLFKAPPPQ